MIARGGQCRRVVYTPGQSTWAAMRYTGEYQIRRSREEERTSLEVKLPGTFLAFPGDSVRLELETRWASPATYRVAEAEGTTASPPDRGDHHVDIEGADVRCGYPEQLKAAR